MAVDRALEQISGFGADLIALRHEIHRRPEVGYEEFHTAALVARELKQLGIAVTENVAGTGVVGSLTGKRLSRRAIGLRADLDALHVSEQSKAAYASQVPGKMHACGHDGHTAMLLGAARYLAENPDFAGAVHFIFQPAEEGLGGGRRMVEEGLFDRFPVDAVYGMHNLPGLAAGSFAIRPGPMMAASDRWGVTIRGTGGHGGADASSAGKYRQTTRPS
jgi:amidohydrolase